MISSHITTAVQCCWAHIICAHTWLFSNSSFLFSPFLSFFLLFLFLFGCFYFFWIPYCAYISSTYLGTVLQLWRPRPQTGCVGQKWTIRTSARHRYLLGEFKNHSWNVESHCILPSFLALYFLFVLFERDVVPDRAHFRPKRSSYDGLSLRLCSNRWRNCWRRRQNDHLMPLPNF